MAAIRATVDSMVSNVCDSCVGTANASGSERKTLTRPPILTAGSVPLRDPTAQGLVCAVAKFDGISQVEIVGVVALWRRGVQHENSRQCELSGEGCFPGLSFGRPTVPCSVARSSPLLYGSTNSPPSLWFSISEELTVVSRSERYSVVRE